MKSKSTFPLKISVFRVVRNVICSQLLTVFIIQGYSKTLFNWFVKFFGKTSLIICKINFYKSFADTAACALCALADSIVYPSITFTFQFILITCLELCKTRINLSLNKHLATVLKTVDIGNMTTFTDCKQRYIYSAL